MRRYLTWFALLTVALSAAVAGLVFWVDPYDYWDHAESRWTAEKPAAMRLGLLTKMRQLPRVAPHTLIVGNSRPASGFDPQSPVWRPDDQPVYNMAVPGLGQPDVLASADWALKTLKNPPKTLLVGLEFMDALQPVAVWQAGASTPTLPSVPDPLAPKTLVRVLFSLDALMDTARTLAYQGRPDVARLTDRGFSHMGDYAASVAQEGAWPFFEQRAVENVKRYLRTDDKLAHPGPGGNPALRSLELFLRAHAKGPTRIILFTYPYHAQLLETLRATGRREEFVQWKRDITAIAARHEVPLWDFAQYNAHTMVPVPASGVISAVPTYWEAGHYRPALGDAMVARMLALPNADTAFGERLRPDTLSAVLTRQQADQVLFNQQQGDVGRYIDTLVTRQRSAILNGE